MTRTTQWGGPPEPPPVRITTQHEAYTPAADLGERIHRLAATRLRRGPLIGASASICVVIDAGRISVVLDAMNEREELDLLAALASRPRGARLLHEAVRLAEDAQRPLWEEVA
ncbi:MAG: hypothetical protein U0R69_17025 [Gaiellales bacterium]